MDRKHYPRFSNNLLTLSNAAVRRKQTAHCVRDGLLAGNIQMAVNVGGHFDVGMSQPFLHVFQGHPLTEQQTGAAVPLRYNYDKPGKPRISRVFGYLARFFILFQTEKSSREVVIS